MKIAHTLAAALLAAALAGPAWAAASLQGEVLEVRDVQSYTYLRLATSDGEVWAAVPSAKLKKGERVTITDPTVMQGFESKTLGRTFDKIVFGQLAAPGGATAAASPHGATPGPAAAPAAVKVAKASGPDARTVAEVVNRRAALENKPVTVHAQVVKVNNGIMGKNWLHLRDGTGSAADGSDDLIATSQDTAKVGDIVTVKGRVHTDVDLGSGYRFAVVIGEATIAK